MRAILVLILLSALSACVAPQVDYNAIDDRPALIGAVDSRGQPIAVGLSMRELAETGGAAAPSGGK